jgi:hypothetical protein
MNYSPIIIISVFRSGSNLIKDVLCHLPGFGTWPAENINFIWRHGNSLREDDELGIAEANNNVVNYIRLAFSKFAKKSGNKYLVEKTEANTLRIGFVNKIFPHAKFIFVVRDGRDAIASMLNRRKQPLDLTFLLKKAQFIPVSDIPVVIYRYIKNIIRRYFFKSKGNYYLGPIYKGMEKELKNYTEDEIVALQWATCIKKANEDLKKIDSNRVHIIKYEEFVKTPFEEITALFKYVDIDTDTEESKSIMNKILCAEMGKETASPEMKLVKGISDKSVGRWKKQLDTKTINLITPLIEKPMKELGYF